MRTLLVGAASVVMNARSRLVKHTNAMRVSGKQISWDEANSIVKGTETVLVTGVLKVCTRSKPGASASKGLR